MKLDLNISARDAKLLVLTIVIVAFGALGMVARSQLEKMRMLRLEMEELESRLELQRSTIGQTDEFERQYELVKDKMPVFPRNLNTSDSLRRELVATASQCGLDIQTHDAPQKETMRAGAYELPIGVRRFEGTLKQILDFVYVLESTGSMVEFWELQFRPLKNKQGYFYGSFKLHSVYMRGDAPESATKQETP